MGNKQFSGTLIAFYEGWRQRRAGFLLTFLAAEKSEAPAGEP
jgi:hypothetical protein